MGHFIVSNFVVLAIVAMAVMIGLNLLVRKVIGMEFLRSHHEVSDPLLACVGTLFAILLGFMVANSMSRFEEARINVEREAGAISDIYRLSRGLPEKAGNVIRNDCLHYVDGVIDQEWPLMEKRKMSYEVWSKYGEIWTDVLAYEPQTARDTNIHATMLNCMVTLGDCRRVRATQMSYSVPEVLWGVVLIGAGAAGILVVFFGIENILIQTFTTALVSLVLSLNVFLLAVYDDPFAGDISVKPHAFRVARSSLSRRYKQKTAIPNIEADAEEDSDNAEEDDSEPDAHVQGTPKSALPGANNHPTASAIPF